MTKVKQFRWLVWNPLRTIHRKSSDQCLTPLTAECVSLRSFLIPTKITNGAPFGSQTETQLFVGVVQLCLSTTEQSQPTTISTIFKVTHGRMEFNLLKHYISHGIATENQSDPVFGDRKPRVRHGEQSNNKVQLLSTRIVETMFHTVCATENRQNLFLVTVNHA